MSFKHCQLCKNKAFDIQTGTFCSLTNSIPDFDVYCRKISFNENLESKINEVNIKFEETKRAKKWVYSYFVTYLIMSLLVLFFTYKFNNYIYDILSKASARAIYFGVLIVILIVFICVVIVLLGYAFGALNRFRFDSKKHTADKLELDAILKLYNIEYDFKITFKDRILMPTDIQTELKIKNCKV